MVVIEAGVSYLVTNYNQMFEDKTQEIRFIKKEVVNNEVLVSNGTTNEELLKVLIHRFKHQNKAMRYPETVSIIEYLEAAEKLLFERKNKLRMSHTYDHTRRNKDKKNC